MLMLANEDMLQKINTTNFHLDSPWQVIQCRGKVVGSRSLDSLLYNCGVWVDWGTCPLLL